MRKTEEVRVKQDTHNKPWRWGRRRRSAGERQKAKVIIIIIRRAVYSSSSSSSSVLAELLNNRNGPWSGQRGESSKCGQSNIKRDYYYYHYDYYDYYDLVG